jgi:hypothetical protein
MQSVAPCNELPTLTVCRSYPETPIEVKPKQPFVGPGFELVQTLATTPASVMGKRAKVVGNFVYCINYLVIIYYRVTCKWYFLSEFEDQF